MRLDAAERTSEVLVGDKARILGCSSEGVRYLERTARLRVVRRIGNLRVFARVEVERLAEERRQAART